MEKKRWAWRGDKKWRRKLGRIARTRLRSSVNIFCEGHIRFASYMQRSNKIRCAKKKDGVIRFEDGLDSTRYCEERTCETLRYHSFWRSLLKIWTVMKNIWRRHPIHTDVLHRCEKHKTTTPHVTTIYNEIRSVQNSNETRKTKHIMYCNAIT